MNRYPRPALRATALCIRLGGLALLASLACGRIDLDSPADDADNGDDQNYPPPRITFGPPTSRTVFGPGGPGGPIVPGRPGGDGQLGGEGAPVPIDVPDASAGDASVGAGASEPPNPSDAGAASLDAGAAQLSPGDADRRSCASSPACGDELDSCCTRTLVPTGTFQLGQDGPDAGVLAATDSFYLDKYEVTTARFTQFVADYDSWRAAGNPAVGAGQRYNFPETGWQDRWNTALPLDAAELRANITACSDDPFSSFDVAGNANLPINCVTWYEAFAFCAWDGARLPTELEWEYAARGGDQQRLYPWSRSLDADLPPVSDPVVYNCGRDLDSSEACPFASLPAVGSFPAGKARWLQRDLAGSLAEWVFDGGDLYPTDNCDNCVQTGVDSRRIGRGGSWYDANSSLLTSTDRRGFDPAFRTFFLGFRCASTEYR
jgi:sulfatase modifying factor 1